MESGQIIHIKENNIDAYWYIESICFGAMNQESVIHISRCDGTRLPDCLGKIQAMFVPELMIRKLLESGIAKIYDEFPEYKHALTE